MSATSAKLEPLQITAYTDEDYSTVYKKPYSVMINPESIKWQRTITYNEEQPPGSSITSQKYKKTPSPKLSFDIIIDATGIVSASRTNVAGEIGMLTDLVFKFNGKIHRPNYVKIQWGDKISFKGVLTSYDTSYTLFKPDGTPLRAKVSLVFTQYLSTAEVAREEKKASPDVTHMADVVQGVSLPQMCQKIWNNDSYYVQVARYNGLNKFRNLKGIDTLIFPPIIQPS